MKKKKILNEGWEAHGSGKMKMSVFFLIWVAEASFKWAKEGMENK